jgi:hypothetical protein
MGLLNTLLSPLGRLISWRSKVPPRPEDGDETSPEAREPSRIPGILCDLASLSGLLMLTTGLWWIYPPSSLIVCGVLLLVGGIMGAKAWAS